MEDRAIPSTHMLGRWAKGSLGFVRVLKAETMYVILFFLGLLIGAVFLVVLLIGDKREARLEAQKKSVTGTNHGGG